MERATELRPPGQRSLVGAREILWALVTKELKVKYKRSALGFLWSLVTPLALVAVYLFVFGYVYKVPKKDFSLFLLSGLLPWQYFNMSLVSGTNSIVDNAPVVRRVYFPRILLPISTVVANLINFLIGLSLLALVVALTGRPLWLYLPWLLVAVFMETLLCVGAVLALSVWNVYLRDIRQVINLLSLVLFFGTPIVYELEQVPARFRPLLLANPLSAVMETYRAALFDASIPDLRVVAIGLLEVGLVLAFGLAVFRRQAPHLAKEL